MHNAITGVPAEHAVPASQATGMAEFRSLISRSFVPLDVQQVNHAPFSAQLRGVEAGSVAFTEVDAHPHLVERTSETIATGGSGFYKVSLLLSGSSVLVQDGKELVMRPGELTIYDTSRPYSLLFDRHFRNIVMMFPKSQLQLPLPFTEQLMATSLSQAHPTLAPIVTSFLAQFPRQLTGVSAHTRERLARTSTDMVSMLCAGLLDVSRVESDPHQIMLQQVYQYIDHHLGSSDLSPNGIAAAHFISTRHLHSLFAEQGSTVSTWIREQRLERCAQDLRDPLLADRTVLAIAQHWGFTDAAHFSRVFKTRFGVSPRTARQSGVPEAALSHS